MQPKFTQRSLVYFLTRLSMFIALIASTTLISYAQQRTAQKTNQLADYQARLQQKINIANNGRQNVIAPVVANNDLGVSNSSARQASTLISRANRTEAVCATFTGALAAGDPTMSFRLNRNGVQGVCPGPKPFAPALAANTYYDTYTWTNSSGLTQCATFTLSTTDVAANIEFGVYSGAFNPADLSVNFFTDPGLSSGTPPNNTVCSANVNAGQTLTFVVFSPNALATASNYTLTVDLPLCSSAPCAATPTPGNTMSTVSTVCPGINFTLSLQNATAGSGVTYQWQSAATSAGPWTNISGATGSTLTTTQSAATCYRCVVTCAGNGAGNSNSVCVALTPTTGCYCTPGVTDCTDDDMITRVRFSSLDNASTCGTGPPAGYTNYTSTVAAPVVIAGAPNPLMIDKPTIWSEGAAVWIDYNQNGTFEASEKTNFPAVPAATATLTGNIAIPAGALTGVTRMRVRLQFAGVPADPCAAYAFGETEDYNVNIQPCVPIAITTHPANTSITCGANASFTVATTGSLPVYGWEWRPNASTAWQLVANGLSVAGGGVYSGATTSTLTVTAATAANNGFQYRALVSGGCSAIDFSNTATLTVNPIVPTVTPASATICAGTVQSLTLTNPSSPSTTTFTATGLPMNIPDYGSASAAGLAGISKVIPVALPAGSIISNVAVRFSIPSHTWAGDLVIVLKAPNGNVLNLSYGITETGAGPTLAGGFTNTVISGMGTVALGTGAEPWTGTFRADAFTAPTAANTNRPVGPTGFTTPMVNSFAGLYSVPSGNWTFAVYDAYNGDTGSLTDLSISITYGAPTAGTWTGPATTMFTDAGATVAYTGTPATTIYVKPTVTSNYQVSFTTGAPCTSATTTIPVTVVNPAVIATSPSNASVCTGGNTSFTASATGGPIAYQWQVSTDNGLTWANVSNGALYGGATTSTLTVTGVTIAGPNMTGYRYRAVATAAPCAGSVMSNAATLTVLPLPAVTLTASDLQLTPGQTSTLTATSIPAAASYVWKLNGVTIAGVTGATYVADIDKLGTYTVTAVSTSTPACTSTASLAGSVTIGTEAADRLWIYPNPNTGVFQVRLYYPTDNPGSVSERRVVYIYNSIGEKIMSKEFALNNNSPQYLRMDFDLTNLAAGTYAVKVVDKVTGTITSGLFVKQ